MQRVRVPTPRDVVDLYIAVERNGSLELGERDMKDLLYDHGYCYYCI